MSEEEKKIQVELEAEIEKDLEEEIKDGIYQLALRLHRLYRQRKSADQSAAGAGKTISELNIVIKMEGETKIEIKETERETRLKNSSRSVNSTATASVYQYSNWAKTLRSGAGATGSVVHKRNDGSYKAKVMNSGRDSPRTR